MQDFASTAFLDRSGVMRECSISSRGQDHLELRVGRAIAPVLSNGYVVPALPVEFHRHGVAAYDFSDFEFLDLRHINELAEREGALYVLSVSLRPTKVDAFVEFMTRFGGARRRGDLPYIFGVALEGPLLASFGGTPETGAWLPTGAEWEAIASCGEHGLQYAVLSPDGMLEGSCLAGQIEPATPSLDWIVATLVEAGVRPALGHFQKRDPAASAACVETVLRSAESHSDAPLWSMVAVDHLFNDMPLRFRHAWRTPEDRIRRPREIESLELDRWNMGNLEQRVGEVPASLMRAARDGRLTLCLNYDGDHVDLDVCRRVTELVGARNIIAMTDATDVNFLGTQKLERRPGSGLWYQNSGTVAAGTGSIDLQMANIRGLGFSEAEVWEMVSFVPLGVLERSTPTSNGLSPERYCHVSSDGERRPLPGTLRIDAKGLVAETP